MIKALLVVGFSFFNPQVPDSTGTETIDGKIFIIHQVMEKETLYGISRRYGTNVEEILRYNPKADAGLEIGQVLKVPYTRRVVAKVPATGTRHTVREKETLYSISRTYNVTIEELRQWNGLTSNNLSVGQDLIIRKANTVGNPPSATVADDQPARSVNGRHTVGAGETLFSISRRYGVTVDDIRKWNGLAGNDVRIGQALIVEGAGRETVQPAVTQSTPANSGNQNVTPSETAAVTRQETQTLPKNDTPVVATTSDAPVAPVKEQTVTISESVRGSDEIIQGGLAELIEGTEGNRKYLALHRTAPAGTILKVRNEMNNREVFVRVMGKLPDTALTQNIIIKISRSAYDRLGAIDPKFRVEVTYYKPQ